MQPQPPTTGTAASPDTARAASGRDPSPAPRGGDPQARHPDDDAGERGGDIDSGAEDALDLALDEGSDGEVPSADVRSDSYDDEANERR